MKMILGMLMLYLPLTALAQAPDEDPIQVVDSLIGLSEDATDTGDYENAITLNIQAENLALARWGDRHPAYLNAAVNHGRILHYQRDWEGAETWYLKAISIADEILDKEDPIRLRVMFNLAILYRGMGQYTRAEPLYQEVRAIRKQTLGISHPGYLACLNDLGIIYSQMGDPDKAEAVYREALDILRQTPDADRQRLANFLDGLGGIFLEKGQYDQAEPWIKEAIDIRRQALGDHHPDYASGLHHLAICYHRKGWFEKAEPLYRESNTIFREVLGENHPFFAYSLNCLAVLYENLGAFDKAEPLLLESLDIREGTLGKGHPEYGHALIAMASLYQAMGQFERAEQVFRQALPVLSAALGPDHRDVLLARGNLAILYNAMGRYADAEPLFIQIRDAHVRNEEVDHPDYAATLNNLAEVNTHMGKLEEALLLYREALAIWMRTIGSSHPHFLMGQNNLAALYLNMHRYPEADQTVREAMSSCVSAYGRNHPEYARSLHLLALLLTSEERYTEVAPLLQELADIRYAQMETAMTFLSDRELHDYVSLYAADLDRLLWFAARSGDQTVLPACYDNVLFTKSLLLRNAGRVRQGAEQDPVTRDRLAELMGCQRQLADLYVKPVNDRDSLQVSRLEDQVNTLQKELARQVAGLGQVASRAGWQEVRDALGEGEVALEFVRFPGNDLQEPERILYGAMMVSNGWETPRFQVLCEEGSLDSLLMGMSTDQVATINALYRLSTRGFKPDTGGKKGLYDLVWKPLEPHLSGSTVIYVAPVGLLHRVNLNAIPVSETESLADRYTLKSLISTRTLALPKQPVDARRSGALFGDIDYERAADLLTSEPVLATRSSAVQSMAPMEPGVRGGGWTSLPATGREVDGIEKTALQAGYDIRKFKGEEASEEAVKALGSANMPSPRFLHLATHGYFFPDPVSKEPRLLDDQPVFQVSAHPMMRSGLILSGGNAGWLGGSLPAGGENGVLTAYEICQLDLSATELVVLSACETGLGDIQGNEGVYGLQRAFKIAGAKYIIMSLWQVPDKQTSLLMTTFYRNWLNAEGPDAGGKGMAIPEAFHAAQKELRDMGFDPWQWAGFVLVE